MPPTRDRQLNETAIPTSAGMETPTETTTRIRRALEPSVSTNELVTPPATITVPEPARANIPAGTLNIARNVSRNAQGFIEAQTAEQQRLRELQDTYGALTDQGSLSDLFREQREAFGATPETLNELRDIQLRLNDLDTGSGITQTQIEGAAGQTLGTAQREVTQEQRENAVRTAGLAARAAVLQGSIETATQLAKDAVNIEYQDRTLTAQNLLQQIDMVQGQVSEQNAQLLEEERRQYEAELETIKQVKDNVAAAIVADATQSEITQLTSDDLGDAEKIALSQSILARNASKEIALERENTRSTIDARNADTAQGWQSLDIRKQELQLSRERLAAEQQASGNIYGTIDGEPQNATQALVNGYADRLTESEAIFDAVADQFADPLAWGKFLPTVLQSGERQQYEQAKRNFVNAVLRRESGAVIADSEFANAEQQYFPQPGDEPETVLQKEANRNTVINSFYQQANVPRPVFAGDIIESEGKKYQVAGDGVTLIEI